MRVLLWIPTMAAMTACGASTGAASTDPATDAAGATDAASADGAATADVTTAADAVGGADVAGTGITGSCAYTNPFSKGPECKSYDVPGWTADTAIADCKNAMGGAGTFTPGVACSTASALGTCKVAKDGEPGYTLVSGGTDASQCATAKLGCETFAGGAFTPAGACADTTGPSDPGTGGGYGQTPFVQPYTVCKDALPGEPAGQSAGGQVCTHVMISGCTEPGRHYEDYGVCADVLTQRPYWTGEPAKTTDAADPRLKDPVFMAELAWSKEQLAASACVCCHSEKSAPNHAPSGWYVDMDGIWLDGVADSGMAMLTGLADSTQLGAYPAKDNNGFDRHDLGIPTTDVPRMRKFLLAEWARRGKTEDQGKAYAPFGGPLVTQSTYVPEPCSADEGVDATGKVTWLGGDARYVYVLAKDAANPGVPPNLDVPEKTVWMVDVPTKAKAMKSGIMYGTLAGDQVQRVPTTGQAPALVPGQTYYLYVLVDVGFPASRCTFVAK